MSAPQRRQPLALVPGTDTAADNSVDDASHTPGTDSADHADEFCGPTAESVIDQWAPEHQLVGALMWLTADAARPVLELVPDTAIWGPTARWAYEIIRGLVNDGRKPDPVLVLATARHQPAVQALIPDAAPGEHAYRQLALYLADAYTQTIAPEAAACYAREVLDEAYRRAFAEHGMRMQQLAESGAERRVICRKDFALSRIAKKWIGELYAMAHTPTVRRTSR